MMSDTERGLKLIKLFRSLLIVGSAFLENSAFAQNIDESNCLQYVGGGGFGDFECYEANSKTLLADSNKITDSILKNTQVERAAKSALSRYIKSQNESAEACDLPILLEYPSEKERASRDHIQVYDVMAAYCRFGLRKQQNEFLHDFSSITND